MDLYIYEDDMQDFQDIIICALRYSLGRKTYITDTTAKFIKKYCDYHDNNFTCVMDERVCKVMLRDINRYMEDRKNGLIKDDKCDYDTWIDLQNWLFDLAKKENFNVVGYEVR